MEKLTAKNMEIIIISCISSCISIVSALAREF